MLFALASPYGLLTPRFSGVTFISRGLRVKSSRPGVVSTVKKIIDPAAKLHRSLVSNCSKYVLIGDYNHG